MEGEWRRWVRHWNEYTPTDKSEAKLTGNATCRVLWERMQARGSIEVRGFGADGEMLATGMALLRKGVGQGRVEQVVRKLQPDVTAGECLLEQLKLEGSDSILLKELEWKESLLAGGKEAEEASAAKASQAATDFSHSSVEVSTSGTDGKCCLPGCPSRGRLHRGARWRRKSSRGGPPEAPPAAPWRSPG